MKELEQRTATGVKVVKQRQKKKKKATWRIQRKHSSTKERAVIVKQMTEGVIKYNAHSSDDIDEKWTTQAGYCTYSVCLPD